LQQGEQFKHNIFKQISTLIVDPNCKPLVPSLIRRLAKNLRPSQLVTRGRVAGSLAGRVGGGIFQQEEMAVSLQMFPTYAWLLGYSIQR
jgi:hypothetical protein